MKPFIHSPVLAGRILRQNHLSAKPDFSHNVGLKQACVLIAFATAEDELASDQGVEAVTDRRPLAAVHRLARVWLAALP
jgi:hypothetical protein